jgi:GT2 family glycosyltransferase
MMSIPDRHDLVGNIDGYENGVLSGWVLDGSRADEVLEVSVWCGDWCAGQSRVDIHREDLEKAFRTSGRHGFSVALHGTPENLGQMLVLRDASTNRKVDAPEFRFPGEPLVGGVRSLRVEGACVLVDFEFSREVSSIPVSVFDDDRLLHVATHDLPAGRSELALALPPDLYDGRAHAIGVRLGSGGISERYFGFLRPIQTPWRHLARSSGSASLVGHHPLEAYRYHSLQRQMAERSGADFEPIRVAHEIVCQMQIDERREYEPLTLPHTDSPEVSIVIPAFDNFHLTYHCVASLILAFNRVSYEVIVADDGSSDHTASCEQLIKNLKVVRTEKNRGFVRTCNGAAKAARGEFVVFLNNDVEVTSGWLDELVDSFSRFPRAGLVGAKLLDAEGRLQDAGGIVWGSGTPWNYGRGGNPKEPRYCYARQVDYLSGSALCIRRSVWNDVGGFSSEFAPAYYEDTDLAFKVRDAGHQVWYVPSSEVVHFEGGTSGTDPNRGAKRHQAENAGTFRNKWINSFRTGSPEGERVDLEKDRQAIARALVIDYTTPDANFDAGGYAAVEEIRLLQSLGIQITFVAENLAHLGKPTVELQRMGVEVVHAPFALSILELLDHRGGEFDLVYVTRHDVADRHLAAIQERTDAKIVLNVADLHFLRELRAAATGEFSFEEALTTRDAELRVLGDVDAVLTYSDTEKSVIVSHGLAPEKVFHCPWVSTPKPTKRPFEEREGMMFLGNFNHQPNQVAVKWFVDQVMPRLEIKAPQKRFYVVGANITDEIRALGSKNVHVVGYVEDLAEIFDCVRVFVAPLTFGAGVKGKIIEAMAHGVPIVGTPIAIESAGLVNGITTLVAETPDAFAAAIDGLIENEEIWGNLRDAALSSVAWNCSAQHGREAFADLLDHLGVLHLDPRAAGA